MATNVAFERVSSTQFKISDEDIKLIAQRGMSSITECHEEEQSSLVEFKMGKDTLVIFKSKSEAAFGYLPLVLDTVREQDCIFTEKTDLRRQLDVLTGELR